MKKLLVVAVALASLVSVGAWAEEGSELEISGNVTTVAGWERPSKNANFGTDGILSDGLIAPGALSTDTFGFFVDQAELDLAKSFGENIRIRADIDFMATAVGAADDFAGVVDLEQGYVTANIPVGNGMEFLVGKYNSGIGLDPVDRNELSTVSFSTVHRLLLPQNLTGLRLGYDFSEATRFELLVVNDLADHVVGASSDIPSGAFNLSYAWGDEGNKSWIKLSGAGGPEQATKKHFSFLGDLSGNFAVSDALSVGAEGLYRQDNAPAATADNAQYIAGQLKGRYAFSDVWDGTLRYSFIWDLDNAQGAVPATGYVVANHEVGLTGLGAAGTMHSLSIATGYQITDGARFVIEGAVDVSRPSGAGTTGFTPGLAGMFAYSF